MRDFLEEYDEHTMDVFQLHKKRISFSVDESLNYRVDLEFGFDNHPVRCSIATRGLWFQVRIEE